MLCPIKLGQKWCFLVCTQSEPKTLYIPSMPSTNKLYPFSFSSKNCFLNQLIRSSFLLPRLWEYNTNRERHTHTYIHVYCRIYVYRCSLALPTDFWQNLILNIWSIRTHILHSSFYCCVFFLKGKRRERILEFLLCPRHLEISKYFRKL